MGKLSHFQGFAPQATFLMQTIKTESCLTQLCGAFKVGGIYNAKEKAV